MVRKNNNSPHHNHSYNNSLFAVFVVWRLGAAVFHILSISTEEHGVLSAGLGRNPQGALPPPSASDQ